MKTLYVLGLLLMAAACQNDPKPAENTVAKDTVIIRDTVVVKEDKPESPAPHKSTPPKTTPQPEPEQAPAWQAKMDEYHSLRCRQHKGNGTTTDRIRQVELYRELLKIREGLNKDERFYFATALGKAEDMSTCP